MNALHSFMHAIGNFAKVESHSRLRMCAMPIRDSFVKTLTAEIHQIGVNYNQVVKLLHSTTNEKDIQNLLRELISLTGEVKQLQNQTVELTEYYRNEQ